MTFLPTCRRLFFRGLPVILGSIAAAASVVHGQEDPLVAVEDRGVEIVPGGFVPLPPGLLRFDMPQSAADLRDLAGAADWDRFTADGLSAPVTVAVEPAIIGNVRQGHRVRGAFTLHAPLERLRTDDSLRRSLAAGDDVKGSTIRQLTPDERAAAGLPADDTAGEQLVRIELTLLNRVVIRGVVRATRREHPDGIAVAWDFDPRLATNATWRPTWSRLDTNELGSRVEGPPQPYAGGAGVVAVRRLGSAGGIDLLVVESRMVLAEPEAWFQGSNQLRSKIGIATQEGVRTLRRRLAAAR